MYKQTETSSFCEHRFARNQLPVAPEVSPIVAAASAPEGMAVEQAAVQTNTAKSLASLKTNILGGAVNGTGLDAVTAKALGLNLALGALGVVFGVAAGIGGVRWAYRKAFQDPNTRIV